MVSEILLICEKPMPYYAINDKDISFNIIYIWVNTKLLQSFLQNLLLLKSLSGSELLDAIMTLLETVGNDRGS